MAFGTIKASSGQGGATERAPAGNHPAACVAIIDMGTQWNDGFQGAPGSWSHRAYFVWEMVSKKVTGYKDRNHVIAIDLNWSMHEKAKLREFVQARLGRKVPDGEDFDILGELGQPCLLNVVAGNKDYTKIKSVSAVPDGFTVPAPINKPFAWELNEATLSEIPDWIPYLYGRSIADHIRECKEWGGKAGEDKALAGTAAAGGGATGQGVNTAPQTAGEIPY